MIEQVWFQLFKKVPDAINTGLNLGRAVVAAVTGGDTSKYLTNAALAGGAMIPGIGQGVSGTKLAAKVLQKQYCSPMSV